MRRLIIALLSLLLVASAFALIHRKTLRSDETSVQMTPEEHYYLATFFNVILFSDDFSYLLFGSKPVACTSFEKSIPFNFSYECVSGFNFTINKGLEVFKKYRHLFSSRNIIVHLSEDADYTYLLMINRENLLKTLEEHINDFQQVLGQNYTTDSLFAQITGKEYLADVIKNHEALLGILLGYGRNNAWNFHQKNKLSRRLNRFKPPIKRDSSLEKEFAELVKKTTFFSDDVHEKKYILKSPRIPLLHFMADPNSPETKKLREQYGKEREDMRRLFSRRDCANATFQKLMD